MNTRRQMLAKILLGLVLAVLAGLATIVIKDTLASQQPENALPVMEVWFYSGRDEGQLLSPTHVKRDRYEWRFLFSPEYGGGVDLTPWQEIPPALVPPVATLELEFSWEPRTCRVYFMQGEGVFEEIAGEVKAPSTPGVYTYKVEASWETTRNVEYFFVVEVPKW